MMNTELQAVIEYMERERGIDRETMIQAVEGALITASRKSVNAKDHLRVEIDRKTFKVHAYATVTVVSGFPANESEISLLDAKEIDPNVDVGDEIEREVEPQQFGRIAAQTAKQAILHRIRMAEKDKIYDEHKDREGDIATGTIRRFERNDVIVDLGVGEGILPSRERVATEDYNVNDKIRCYVLNVSNPASGPQIVLSRSHPNFVRRLFELEVAEIADGTVEIKGIAREAGFRSKVAVWCADPKVDPVGACVGMRGIRVKNICRELGGEKIDIVRWNPDIATYIANSLQPATLSKVEVDERTQTVTVRVHPDQLSLAIGKKGQNARLTAKLTGWRVDITREEVELNFEEKVAKAIETLAEIPGVSEEIAIALVQNGFLSLEGIVAADVEDIAAAEEIDLAAAKRIKSAAEAHYEKQFGSEEKDL
ncbi:MAG: transcription termination/antitermination protein NusA [Verrucomicrobia bacterium]|nr:transcription termination/antitermination protein NusA [Verrucomicrobiota bacterium]